MNLIQKILLESELESENNFYLNPIFQPNERAKQELERRRKVLESLIKKLELGLQKINKAYENRQWESEIERLFLEYFHNARIVLYDHSRLREQVFLSKRNSIYSKIIASFFVKLKVYTIKDRVIDFFKEKGYKKTNEVNSFLKEMFKEYFKLVDWEMK